MQGKEVAEYESRHEQRINEATIKHKQAVDSVAAHAHELEDKTLADTEERFHQVEREKECELEHDINSHMDRINQAEKRRLSLLAEKQAHVKQVNHEHHEAARIRLEVLKHGQDDLKDKSAKELSEKMKSHNEAHDRHLSDIKYTVRFDRCCDIHANLS
jgi:hypothetical protein